MFDSSRYTLPEVFLDMAVDIIIFRYVTVNTVSNKWSKNFGYNRF